MGIKIYTTEKNEMIRHANAQIPTESTKMREIKSVRKIFRLKIFVL